MNMHEFNETFIKPWTRGSGCGYSLLVNSKEPLTAQIMVSHTWGEDVDNFVEAIMLWFKMHGLSLDLPVWVCSVGLYQCEDGAGPSIKEQLGLEPFKQIITSDAVKPIGMVVVHTLTQDVYKRLWCVYEMDAATAQGLSVHGAYPPVNIAKLQDTLSLDVRTREASCSNPDDEAMIRALIVEHGGYERLDKTIHNLRRKMFETAAPFLEAERHIGNSAYHLASSEL